MKNILLYLNLNSESLKLVKKELEKNFDSVYLSDWSKYKSLGNKKYLSISSLVSCDKYILNYINEYPIKDDQQYNKIYNKNFSIYCSMLQRRLSFYEKINFFDYRNYFNIHYKFLEKFLIVNNINYLIIPPSASGGFDLLIREIAYSLKIKILLVENFHSNKFFFTTRFDDWGKFNFAPKIFKKCTAYIYKKDPVRLFYISNWEKAIKKKSFINRLEKITKKFFELFFLFIKKRNLFYISLSNYFVIKYEKNGLKKNNYYFKKIRLFPKNFIYFPLAYQPESTTLAFSPEYDDQILAIEKLLKYLPSNWKVLVKEHPYQNNYSYRSIKFFERIVNNSKIILINSNTKNEILLRKCKFVATLTGNSGWEAIRFGRPVLLFGSPWYLKCPGAYHIDDLKNINQILSIRFTLEDIKKYIENLTRKMGDGLINNDYLNARDMFTNFKNNNYNLKLEVKKFSNSLNKILLYKKIRW